ncbi:MAG: S-methyl-5'-thioadenosine phosphorylase [Candidatus Latescibacterota bacterium]
MAEREVAPACLGVIGGSGVYHMEGVERLAEHTVDTPFGRPSDSVLEARLGDRTVLFLPRHGRGHRYLPSEVNSRANIYALKSLGATHVMSISAVGIMQEQIRPGDMVVPDQIFDRTRGLRPSTFFGSGVVGHVPFADPFCAALGACLVQAARRCGATVHEGGTYVCMEGPQFSTRAESHFYRRQVQAAVIGMTALPEAKLAREAEMCYAMLAMGTDYDCWHETEEDVEIGSVLAILRQNAALANAVVRAVAASLPQEADCACQRAAEHAIITAPDAIPEEARHRLRLLFGKYLDRGPA